MTSVIFPEGFRLAGLIREHPRRAFDCNQSSVNDWLRTKALQHQTKRLSSTKVLLDPADVIAGFYTLAVGQVDFADLPNDLVGHLPRRPLPVAVLAWLGVDRRHQGSGLGERVLAQALRDCHEAGHTFAFIAVIVDCVDDRAKSFYERWNFQEIPGNPYRLFLSGKALSAMMFAS